jgi:pimeloyl-ACP methyl ester carboxylesterase
MRDSNAFLLIVVAAIGGCGRAPVNLTSAAPIVEIESVPFEVDLGGWTSAAELVHPVKAGAYGDGPWPTVLMISGNGPHDMDVTLPGEGESFKLFAQIATELASRGCAVVRYHKRFVEGPNKFDPRFFVEQSLVTFAADAQKVLNASLLDPRCDPDRVFLYGWSEGTAIAAQLATERGDIDGLILQSAVGLPWRDMVRSWIADVGVPYAQGKDGGTVTNEKLAAALEGKGGMVAKLGASFLAEPMRPGGSIRVSSRIDSDGNGELDPETEIKASMDAMLDFAFSRLGNVHLYSLGKTLPTVTEQAAKLKLPILVLQGVNDASTSLLSGRTLAVALKASGNDRVKLMEFPGLGHTLGAASSVFDDLGRSPDTETILPICEWIRAQSRK